MNMGVTPFSYENDWQHQLYSAKLELSKLSI